MRTSTVIETDRHFNESHYLTQLQAQLLSVDEGHSATQNKYITPYFGESMAIWNILSFGTDSQERNYTAGGFFCFCFFLQFDNLFLPQQPKGDDRSCGQKCKNIQRHS